MANTNKTNCEHYRDFMIINGQRKPIKPYCNALKCLDCENCTWFDKIGEDPEMRRLRKHREYLERQELYNTNNNINTERI